MQFKLFALLPLLSLFASAVTANPLPQHGGSADLMERTYDEMNNEVFLRSFDGGDFDVREFMDEFELAAREFYDEVEARGFDEDGTMVSRSDEQIEFEKRFLPLLLGAGATVASKIFGGKRN